MDKISAQTPNFPVIILVIITLDINYLFKFRKSKYLKTKKTVMLGMNFGKITIFWAESRIES